MKRSVILLVLMLYVLCATAQTDSFIHSPDIIDRNSHPSYISIGTGLNNPFGFLGLSYEQRFNPYLALEGGIGKSTWGLKLNAGIKLYLIPDRKRWALI